VSTLLLSMLLRLQKLPCNLPCAAMQLLRPVVPAKAVFR
jgi:hypothetical protein